MTSRSCLSQSHRGQVCTPFALALAIVRTALHKALKKHPVEVARAAQGMNKNGCFVAWEAVNGCKCWKPGLNIFMLNYVDGLKKSSDLSIRFLVITTEIYLPVQFFVMSLIISEFHDRNQPASWVGIAVLFLSVSSRRFLNDKRTTFRPKKPATKVRYIHHPTEHVSEQQSSP